ncbi:glycerate kinase [Geminocystis sp. CENA526]|uniref:glycerate kinase n=1 Tax=Geminocystis sp. CENA526 TaxID=1355871 RepID=UPI003D6E4419
METEQLLQFLIDDELNYSSPLKCYISEELLTKKISLFPVIYPKIKKLLSELTINNNLNIIKTCWYFWLPLALDLADKKQKQLTPLIVGILGGQGTGKTTLTKILTHIWQCLELSSIELSIDDLYKTYHERQELLKTDSRLIWRGVPSTHDVLLGLDIFHRIAMEDYPLEIPRFDKSLYNGMGDRISPKIVTQADIILFEGWLVGMQPVEETAFINPPYPIVTEEDKQFALDNNQRLKEYLPLWQKLDYFLILKPEDYRYSLPWRKEAEHKMIQKTKMGMTDSEIEQFVHYFWKALHPEIYIPPLLNHANLIVNIKFDRTIKSIQRFAVE